MVSHGLHCLFEHLGRAGEIARLGKGSRKIEQRHRRIRLPVYCFIERRSGTRPIARAQVRLAHSSR
jgi:hypothetical protein